MTLTPAQERAYFGQTRVIVQNKVIDTLLKRMIMRSPAAAEKIVVKYTRKMVDLASDYAPRSSESGSNSRSEIPMADTIHAVKLGPSRYSVRTEASYAGAILLGTRAHDIEARATSKRTRAAKADARVAGRLYSQLQKLADINAQGYGPVISRIRTDKKTGRKLGGEVKDLKQYTKKQLIRHNTAINMEEVLNQRIAKAQHEHAAAARKIQKGAKSLSFPWANSPQGNGRYVGRKVHHKAVKANNFMGRARARIAPEFAREIRNWLEGGL